MNLVLVSVDNIYKNVSRKYRGRKLDYEKYFDVVRQYVESSNIEAHAYISEWSKSNKFLSCLRYYGYKIHYNKELVKFKWNVGLCIEVFKHIDNELDTVIIGSSSLEFIPLIVWLRNNGVKVIIFAANINERLRNIADQCIEINHTLLKEERNEPIETA